MERTFKQRWSCRALRRFIKSIKGQPNYFLCNASAEFRKLWIQHRAEIRELTYDFLRDTGREPEIVYPSHSCIDSVMFNRVSNSSAETRIAFLRYEIARLTRERKQIQ